MSPVRPFPARVVREERAPLAVTALAELPAEAGPAPVRVQPDAAAYEEQPAALYVYRQQRGDVAHVGVVCEVATGALVDGRVRGHEAVQPRRVEALVHHNATTSAPPALVALLHHAGEVFARTLTQVCSTSPMLDFPGPDGLRQTVWKVPDAQTAALARELAAATHYVADGHHRVAAALEAWRLAGQPEDAGVLCVVHAMDGLTLSAFHRRVAGPVATDDVMSLLTGAFEVRQVADVPTPAPGCFGVYVEGSWFVASRAAADDETVLDVAVLHDRVLGPLTRLRGATPTSVEITPAHVSVHELVERCVADGGALFTLAPPPLAALTGLADSGGVMPPKTTYFEPKPCTGIFLRP